jgi:hypothetical protein
MLLPPVQKVLGQYTPYSEIGRNPLKLLLMHITMRAESMENTRRQLRKGKLNLSLLIRVTIQRFATDPRDKIYGLLGMTHNDPVLQPDYTLSVAEVYTTATKAMLLQNRDLRVLSFLLDGGADREPNLPSWVLDFQNLTEARSLAPLCGFVEDVCERIYSAAPIVGLDANFTPEFEDADRLLRLKGVALDIVRTIGGCTSCPEFEIVNVAQLAPKLLLSTITQWKSCMASVDQPYVTGEASLVAFWKTVLTDKKVAGYHPGFFGMLNQASEMRLDKNDSSIPPSTLDEEMLLVRALASSSGRMSYLWSRRFAVSEKGYFTLLPGTAKTGDVLCILVGGEMPYVLRPLANGRFQMLGEWYDMFPPKTPAYNGLMTMRYSYVHGMMDGEIAEGVDNRAFTYQLFTLE